MMFFLQRRIHPLQSRVSKLWSYSGSEDPSRVSKKDLDKKGLDKRVRALTTLTKENKIPALAAEYFDSTHPVPAVCVLFLFFFMSTPSPSCDLLLLSNILRLTLS
jgi:hypothetical protein